MEQVQREDVKAAFPAGADAEQAVDIDAVFTMKRMNDAGDRGDAGDQRNAGKPDAFGDYWSGCASGWVGGWWSVRERCRCRWICKCVLHGR